MSEPVVTLENVCKVFPGAGGIRVLDAIDLVIAKGERVAITGPSGSGKSTLLNVLCGLDVPTSGRVLFEGDDLVAMDDDARTRLRRQKIGMIFQTFNLMPTLSAAENVALPLRLRGDSASSANAAANQLLVRVGLEHRLANRPDEMSGGERQRVAIARSLVIGPSILLADEPTGNLDSATGDEILALLDDLHQESGTTIVLVTHNEHAAARCERHVELLDGHIVGDRTGPISVDHG